MVGISGVIDINKEGQRNHTELDVVNLQKDIFVKVSYDFEQEKRFYKK